MSNAIVAGSLSDVMRKENVSLAESFLSVDAILIVDTSGSMMAHDAPGQQMRHDAAESELRALQCQLPGKIAVIAFSDKVEFCPTGIPFRFNGGTDMARALQFVKPADGLGVKFVLISDGYPDNTEKTLDVARTFKSKINTVYIGPERERRGRQFLEQLASATGGQFAKSAEPAMLREPVEQLLLSANG